MKRHHEFLAGSVFCFFACVLLVLWFLTLTVGCSSVDSTRKSEYNFATRRVEPVPGWRVTAEEKAAIAATVAEMKRSADGQTFQIPSPVTPSTNETHR